jgi:hypothetical protein
MAKAAPFIEEQRRMREERRMSDKEYHPDFPGYYWDEKQLRYVLDPAFKTHAANFTGNPSYPVAYDWSTSNAITINTTDTLTVPRYGKHQDQPVKREKKQMFVVQTVKVKAGTIGQVYYEDRVVWESTPQTDTTEGDITTTGAAHARNAAQAAIATALDSVFKEI